MRALMRLAPPLLLKCLPLTNPRKVERKNQPRRGVQRKQQFIWKKLKKKIKEENLLIGML